MPERDDRSSDATEGIATVVQPRASEDVAPESVFVLVVTAGAAKGQSFKLDGVEASRVLIGQSPACEIRLADREVSRRHAALERVGGDLRITDLGSTNGTFVDRVKVIEADLQGGELVRVGTTLFRVDRRPIARGEVLPLPHADGFGRVMGRSREMRRLYPLCERLAHANVPVVIEGETGTGKEVLAESLHEMGPRAQAPFVVFDCTAVPPSLVESELFGHERGAFTGAVAGRKGVFEQAHGGTLLIDEIGDLDLSLQPKLLRAIERCEVRRLGGDRFLQVDVRIMAATRRDLDREVQAGRFRDDLFHRLAIARIELPPLRHRIGDVTALARHFWVALGGDARALPAELLSRWEDYGWPGNVRELRNTVARQLALGDLAQAQTRAGSAETRPSTGPPRPSGPPPAGDATDRLLALDLPFPQTRDAVMEDFEQRYVARLLAQHGGDVARAAAASGIGRRYFQKLRARSSR
jgi:transcriptional regulator with GAF, ATPase, and Fis domain